MKEIVNKQTGDTMSAKEYNSATEEVENAVKSTGQTLDGTGPSTVDPDKFQLSKAISRYAAGAGTYYVCTGDSTPYSLLLPSEYSLPIDYFGGMRVMFAASAANEADPEIQIVDDPNWPTKNLKNIDGGAIPIGYIKAGAWVEAIYESGAGEFRMLNYNVSLAPRMDFKYQQPPGIPGATLTKDVTTKWPIELDGTSTIPGYSFANNLFTLPKGFKYWIELEYNVEQDIIPDNTRVFVSKSAAPNDFILFDLSNTNGYPHNSVLKGFLDLTTEENPVEFGIYARCRDQSGTLGFWANTFSIPELYMRGHIIQTGY